MSRDIIDDFLKRGSFARSEHKHLSLYSKRAVKGARRAHEQGIVASLMWIYDPQNEKAVLSAIHALMGATEWEDWPSAQKAECIVWEIGMISQDEEYQSKRGL